MQPQVYRGLQSIGILPKGRVVGISYCDLSAKARNAVCRYNPRDLVGWFACVSRNFLEQGKGERKKEVICIRERSRAVEEFIEWKLL